MRTRRREVLERALRERREELHERLDDVRERLRGAVAAPGDLTTVPTHAADQDTEGAATAAAAGERCRRELEEVEGALARVGDDAFGRCERCEAPISVERLALLPQARECRRCAASSA